MTPQPSSERLAKALDLADLPELATRARRDEYHDFKSPHVMPEHVLVHDLRATGLPVAEAIAQRVIAGEFDATKAESYEWAASPDGQVAMNALLR